MEAARRALPIYPLREELINAVREHSALVVIGETGSGKTTQIPQYILEEFPKDWHIAVTQPRRIAAISVARRVAKEQKTRLGGELVGYTIRFDDCSTPETRLRYMTDGVLLRETMHDPDLRRYQLIIVDEAHERSLDTDVLLGLLKCARQRRPELRILVMSATLDPKKFSDFFDACHIFTITGRVYPVEIMHHRTARLKQLKSTYVQNTVDTALHVHKTEPKGHMLLFLTGKHEVEQACRELRASSNEIQKSQQTNDRGERLMTMEVYPLYSTMEPHEQASVFDEPPPGVRKVIVATNIAQTSITIPGIRYVIDSGFVKQKMYNPRTGMDALVVTQISQAAALQRSGRAGRTQGGKCYRIYCKEDFENMERETVPEIQRSNLLGVALHMKRVGIDDLLEFKFIDPPEPELIISAIKQLYLLDALTEDGKLTDIGRDMSELPVSPYLSRALIAAARDFNCSREMAMLAAMLSVENIFVEPRDEAKRKQAAKVQSQFHHPSGDHCTLINIYMAWKASDYSSSWCVDHFIRSHAMRSVRNIYNQLCDNMRRISLPIISTVASDTSKDTDTSAKHNEMNTFQPEPILRSLCTAYHMNVVKRPNTWSPCFYRYSPTSEQSVSSSERDAVAFFVSPTSSLSGNLRQAVSQDKSLEWVLFHTVTLIGQPTMNICSYIDPSWIEHRRNINEPDVARLLGRPPTKKQPSIQKMTIDSPSATATATKRAVEQSVTAPATPVDSEQEKKHRAEAIEAARERYLKRKKMKQ